MSCNLGAEFFNLLIQKIDVRQLWLTEGDGAAGPVQLTLSPMRVFVDKPPQCLYNEAA
jgi:hypothetical protein